MQTSYGKYYADVNLGTRKVTPFYGIKKMKTGGWMVYEGWSGDIIQIGFPTKLRAYYYATVMNGTDVSSFFRFGTDMFPKP